MVLSSSGFGVYSPIVLFIICGVQHRVKHDADFAYMLSRNCIIELAFVRLADMIADIENIFVSQNGKLISGPEPEVRL